MSTPSSFSSLDFLPRIIENLTIFHDRTLCVELTPLKPPTYTTGKTLLSQIAQFSFFFTKEESPKSHCFILIYSAKNIRTLSALLSALTLGHVVTVLDAEIGYPPGFFQNFFSKLRPDYILTDTDSASELRTIAAQYQVPIWTFDLVSESLNPNLRQNVHEDYEYLVSILSSRRRFPTLPAMIYYTSGSTKLPKGVLLPYSTLSGLCCYTSSFYNLTPDDIFLHSASLSFVSSLRQFLLPLITPCKFILLKTSDVRNISFLVSILSSQTVSILDINPNLITALTREFVKNPKLVADLTFRLVTSSSDLITKKIINQWHNVVRFPHTFLNMYGQTETGGAITCMEILPDQNQTLLPELQESSATPILPVGKPAINRKILLLNSFQKSLEPPPPVNSWSSKEGSSEKVGEVYIEGDCLMKGYCKEPGLTAETLIPSETPGTQSGSRIFKSRDFGRQDDNLNLTILGRKDSQLKINGFRIEPEFIEAIIVEFPKITQAQVVAYNNILTCFYVAQEIISELDLKKFLLTKLPLYMIPLVYKKTDSLNTTHTGKKTRKQT